MRVIHIITRLILGGAQENTVLCCEDLRQRFGDDVLLVAGPPLGPEGSLLERARNAGIPIEIVPALRREIHPWRDALAYFALRRIIRRFQPDVVHTHSAKAGILGRIAAWRLGVPAVIHTVHGAPFHPYQIAPARWFSIICERYAARRCHALIGVADAMIQLIIDAGVTDRDKCATIYSGMEIEPFLRADERRAAIRRELGYSDEHCVIGKIARLFHLKGHRDVIAMARRLIPRNPQIRFLWVGDGILRSDLEREIAEAGLTSYFRLTGLVDPSHLPDLVGAMDILVHTSLREGLARVLPQALLAGKPVVSYDVDGAREVCLDHQTGFLVPPRDLEALTLAVQRLIDSPELRRQLGRAGQGRCSQMFSHHAMTEQIRALYCRVLEENRRASPLQSS